MDGVTPTPVILGIVFTPLALISVVLRFACRRWKGLPFGTDDWMILPALSFTICHAATVVLSAYLGDLGKKMPMHRDGSVAHTGRLETFQKIQWVSLLTCVAALTVTRLSLIHFYMRIFSVSRFTRLAIVTYVVNIAWGIAFFAGYIFKCTPVQKFWTTSNGQGSCLPQSFNFTFAWTNVALDVHLIVMPLPLIWLLNMRLRQKWSVTAVFCLGTIVLILSLLRALATQSAGAKIQWRKDVSYITAPIFYYSVVETCLAVICACLPTFRPLFTRLSRVFNNAPVDTSFPLGPSRSTLRIDTSSLRSPATLHRCQSTKTFTSTGTTILNFSPNTPHSLWPTRKDSLASPSRQHSSASCRPTTKNTLRAVRSQPILGHSQSARSRIGQLDTPQTPLTPFTPYSPLRPAPLLPRKTRCIDQASHDINHMDSINKLLEASLNQTAKPDDSCGLFEWSPVSKSMEDNLDTLGRARTEVKDLVDQTGGPVSPISPTSLISMSPGSEMTEDFRISALLPQFPEPALRTAKKILGGQQEIAPTGVHTPPGERSGDLILSPRKVESGVVVLDCVSRLEDHKPQALDGKVF